MSDRQERFYQRACYGLLLFHGVVWFTVGMVLDLHPDTADHWVWSRHLSWGYYEHPPMIAWVIRLFTFIMGDNQWAVQAAAQAVALTSFWGLFLLGRRMFDARTAFFGLLVLEATPIYSVGSIIFHINNVCNLFYIWAVLAFWKGFEEAKSRYYYFAGGALGLALLSKVPAVLLPAILFLFLVSSRERIRGLGSVHLYPALFLALLLFSPFLYWNHLHDWISFTAQLEKGLLFSRRDWTQTLGFWLGQPLILGPVLFAFFLAALVYGLKRFRSDRRMALLVLLTLIPLLVFGAASFRGKNSDPVWTDIGWTFGGLLLAAFLVDRFSASSFRKKTFIGVLLFLSGWVPIALLLIQSFSPFLPVAPAADRTLEMRGWRELGWEAGRCYERYFPRQQRVYILADDYQLTAEVSFYAPQQPIPYSFGKSKRNIWVNEEAIRQSGALMVCRPEECQRDQEKAHRFFPRIRWAAESVFMRQGKPAKRFHFYICSP